MFLGGYSAIQAAAGQAHEVNAYQGIKSAVQAIDPDATVDFLPGVTGGTSAAKLTTVDQDSINRAKDYDAVVVVAGTDNGTSAEDRDRKSLDLPGAQAQMIQQAVAANPRTVVYLETVGAVTLSPFQAQTPALLWSSYNGERQGDAIADVLLGKVNPSAHLPFTWYADQSQLPGISDYRIRPAADTMGRTYQYFTGSVAYPFGYGLGYSDFRYSDLKVDRSGVNPDGTFTVTARVTNEGQYAGDAVPQLYVTTPFAPASAERPAKRLEGFTKVHLAPGESTTVSIPVQASALAFFDEKAGKNVVDPGRYGLELGTSSDDIVLRDSVLVSGHTTPRPAVVNAKPIQTGDREAQVAQRVRFDLGTQIDPQLTVSTTDQDVYGYVTKGASTPLPAAMHVTYRSNRPDVVAVDKDGSIRTVGQGIATITATVSYHGGTASTTFTVDVAPAG
jgi:beta-glucosidase